MALAIGHFERIAEEVVERTSDLLSAPVTLIDDRGIVVASSDGSMVGRFVELPRVPDGDAPSDEQASRDGTLAVPITFSNRAGRVLVGRPATGEPISPRLTSVLVELVINQTMVVDRLPSKLELKNKLIHDLLHGSIELEATALREAQILGMDLNAPRVVILIDASDYILAPGRDGQASSEARVHQRAQLVIGTVVDFFHLPNDTICAYIGDGEVAVLKASNLRNLQNWTTADADPTPINPTWANLPALKRASNALLTHILNTTKASISLGIGRHHPGIAGLASSYQDARAALSLGLRFHGQNKVHCLDSLGIAGFIGVADEHTKIDVAAFLLGPLDHEPDLLETLDAFFAFDCSPSEAARALQIHRNTLAYRLDKIASLTGLDPRRFDDAVQIRLALLLRGFRAAPEESTEREEAQPEA